MFTNPLGINSSTPHLSSRPGLETYCWPCSTARSARSHEPSVIGDLSLTSCEYVYGISLFKSLLRNVSSFYTYHIYIDKCSYMFLPHIYIYVVYILEMSSWFLSVARLGSCRPRRWLSGRAFGIPFSGETSLSCLSHEKGAVLGQQKSFPERPMLHPT